MFPDDDRVFPSKIEAERTSSVAPVKMMPDDGRHQSRIMEVKTNPSCSWFKEDSGKIGKPLEINSA